MKAAPPALDAITDKILAYGPAKKNLGKPAKKSTKPKRSKVKSSR